MIQCASARILEVANLQLGSCCSALADVYNLHAILLARLKTYELYSSSHRSAWRFSIAAAVRLGLVERYLLNTSIVSQKG